MRFSREIELESFKRYILSLKDWGEYCLAIRHPVFRNICKLLN